MLYLDNNSEKYTYSVYVRKFLSVDLWPKEFMKSCHQGFGVT